jgi:hypothetical protein
MNDVIVPYRMLYFLNKYNESNIFRSNLAWSSIFI